MSRQEEKRAYVEPARFTTLKRGGPLHNYQVQAIVYNGGHLFPGDANSKDTLLPYTLLTFNQR